MGAVYVLYNSFFNAIVVLVTDFIPALSGHGCVVYAPKSALPIGS